MISLPKTMKALQMQGLNQLVMVEVLIPIPKYNEVLIKTAAATICTSDLHDLKSNPFGIKYPRILGHEGAGVIVQCGSAIKHLSIGARVASHPVVPCGVCNECKRGFEHICSNMGHLGIDRDGCFAEYFIQRADRVRELDLNISFSLGALLEPVAVCLQAISRAGEIESKEVLIVGDGPFGNIIARLANRANAGKVQVLGKGQFRLKMIPNVEVLDSEPIKTVDVAILAVSSPEAVTTSIAALRPRGRLVVFSTLKEPVLLDLFSLHVSELEIVGSCNDENRIEESLECLADTTLNLEEIITHKIPFENWKEAFSLARDGHNKTLKVAITF